MLKVARDVRRKSIQAIENLRQLSLSSTSHSDSSASSDEKEDVQSSQSPTRSGSVLLPVPSISMAYPAESVTSGYSNLQNVNLYGTYPRKPWLNGGQNRPNGFPESANIRGILRNKYEMTPVQHDETFESQDSASQSEIPITRTDGSKYKERIGQTLEFYVRPAVAEFVAVLFSVFTVTLVQGALKDQGLSPTTINAYVAATEALTFLVFLLAFQRIHINPAVTLASLFGAATPWALCLVFWFIQMLAATLAVLLYQLVTIDQPPVIPALITKSSSDWLRGSYRLVLCQSTTTFMVVLTYLLSYQQVPCPKCDAQIFKNPAAMISAVLLCAFLGGLNSTASWNPAKNLAICIATSVRGETVHSWNYHFIFWLGPLIGSLFASFLYRLIFAEQDRRLSSCGKTEDLV